MTNYDKKILLTFDLEEFDIPLEYKQQISIDTQMNITRQGMERIQEIIDKHNISCTFFTTAFFADQNIELVKQLSHKHEIASHAYYHSRFKNEDLLLSKKRLEEITQKEIIGFRMPRMQAVSDKELALAGYKYNSSINPTWLPSRYNHLNKPRTIFKTPDIVNIPASVSPNFRIPLFWLFFKNVPFTFVKKLSSQTINKDGYLNLYFHPWEFADIRKFHLPRWMKNPCDIALCRKMDSYINFLKGKGEFSTIANFIF